MKPVSSNFRTSSAMALSRSWANTHFFYQIGENGGDTFNLWTMIEGEIPDMSSWLQANTSWLSLRNVMSTWCTSQLANVPILVVRSGLESSRVTSSSSSTSSATVVVLLCTLFAGDHPSLTSVAAPRYGQGVPRNTLTWKKKKLYIIIKIFLFVYPLKKIRNTLNQS